jgi:hypothetical protein
MLLGG